MKPILFLTVALFLACCAKKDHKSENKSPQSVAKEQSDFKIIADQSEPDTVKGSMKAKAMGTIADAAITINYYSPAVRGRIIWGGLVPYDQVWVTGAHRATNLEIEQDFKIADKIVPAGKYGFFTIPGKNEWVIILNKNWDQHLVDNYDASQDVARVSVAPQVGSRQERLQYTIKPTSGKEGVISIWWDKMVVEMPLTIQ